MEFLHLIACIYAYTKGQRDFQQCEKIQLKGASKSQRSTLQPVLQFCFEMVKHLATQAMNVRGSHRTSRLACSIALSSSPSDGSKLQNVLDNLNQLHLWVATLFDWVSIARMPPFALFILMWINGLMSFTIELNT